MKRVAVSLCLVWGLSACATPGYFKGVSLDEIEIGSTTERDIRAMFGLPNSQELHGSFSGSETVIYRNVKVTELGSGGRLPGYSGDVTKPERKLHRELQVWFDEEGLVTDYHLEQRRERAPVR